MLSPAEKASLEAFEEFMWTLGDSKRTVRSLWFLAQESSPSAISYFPKRILPLATASPMLRPQRMVLSQFLEHGVVTINKALMSNVRDLTITRHATGQLALFSDRELWQSLQQLKIDVRVREDEMISPWQEPSEHWDEGILDNVDHPLYDVIFQYINSRTICLPELRSLELRQPNLILHDFYCPQLRSLKVTSCLVNSSRSIRTNHFPCLETLLFNLLIASPASTQCEQASRWIRAHPNVSQLTIYGSYNANALLRHAYDSVGTLQWSVPSALQSVTLDFLSERWGEAKDSADAILSTIQLLLQEAPHLTIRLLFSSSTFFESPDFARTLAPSTATLEIFLANRQVLSITLAEMTAEFEGRFQGNVVRFFRCDEYQQTLRAL